MRWEARAFGTISLFFIFSGFLFVFWPASLEYLSRLLTPEKAKAAPVSALNFPDFKAPLKQFSTLYHSYLHEKLKSIYQNTPKIKNGF